MRDSRKNQDLWTLAVGAFLLYLFCRADAAQKKADAADAESASAQADANAAMAAANLAAARAGLPLPYPLAH